MSEIIAIVEAIVMNAKIMKIVWIIVIVEAIEINANIMKIQFALKNEMVRKIGSSKTVAGEV